MSTSPQFVALEDLYVSFGVRAHRKGDVVPAENVEANGWRDKVQHAGTKGAEAAKADATADTV